MEISASNDDSEMLHRKIEGLYRVNQEIIERINHQIKSDHSIVVYEYMIIPVKSNNTYLQYTVNEIQNHVKIKDIVNKWRVPSDSIVPEIPDPDETLYGKHGEIMNMGCSCYSDLVRINKQYVVAEKYVTMLREPTAVKFGHNFKRNFELVQILLGSIETLLMGQPSTLEEKTEAITRVNEEMAQLFQQNDVYTVENYFFDGKSKLGSSNDPYSNNLINKGTLLLTGTHMWKVKCLKVGNYCDLGVVTSSHNSNFDQSNRNSSRGQQNEVNAWGIRNDGKVFPANQTVSQFKKDDVLKFILNCDLKTLSISINDRHVAVIPNVAVPVHIAFSGDSKSKVEIIDV